MSTVAHITFDQYERMVETGCFDGPFRQRVELIRGVITKMAPIGTEHAFAVSRLTDWSYETTDRDHVCVRVQQPLGIASFDSEPEPDLVLAKQKDYSQWHPTPEEVLLLVEVAESAIADDRGTKANLYAEAGITDYWIVNLIDRSIEIHREPREGKYQSVAVIQGDETIAPLALPGASFSRHRVLPKN